jgi:hypothetical protein
MKQRRKKSNKRSAKAVESPEIKHNYNEDVDEEMADDMAS